MPYCRNCGTEHSEDANFCKKCGEQLKYDDLKYNRSNLNHHSNNSTKYTIFMIISIVYPLILFIVFLKSDFISISAKSLDIKVSFRYSIWELITEKNNIENFNINSVIKKELSNDLSDLRDLLIFYFVILIILLFIYYISFISEQIKVEIVEMKYKNIPFFILLSYIVLIALIRCEESEYAYDHVVETDFTPLLIFITGFTFEVIRLNLFKQIKREKYISEIEKYTRELNDKKDQEVQPQNTHSIDYPTFSFEREIENENITDIDIPIDK